MTRPLSTLLDDHHALDEAFARHQEALVMRNPRGAVEHLARFARLLKPHMALEDELLLPVYAARAGRVPGGGVELFTAEHVKLLRTLDELTTMARALVDETPEPVRACRTLVRRTIALLDREYLFKDLIKHHDARERNVLYPHLDRLTSEEERARLWIDIEARCGHDSGTPGDGSSEQGQ